MEEGKIKEKKNSLSIPVFNGGGIAGVLVLGGALATAAFIAFFSRKTSSKKGQSRDSDSLKQNDLMNINNHSDENFNQCCESNGISEVGLAQIGQMDLISTQNSDLEAFSEPEINGVKETVTTVAEDDESFLPEIINRETISLCKDINIDTEEITLLVNKIHDVGEDPPLLEAIEELKNEDDVSKIVLVELLEENVINDVELLEENVINYEVTIEEGSFSERVIEEDVKENQLLMSEEEDSDDDEELDEEESEKSSIETGDSSMESNAEPIWPAESIEKLSIAIEEMKLDYQDSKEDGTIEKDSIGNEDESIKESMEISDNKENNELLTVNYQPVRSGDMRMLILAILGTFLLLLMLGFATEHKAMFSNLVKGDSV